MRCGGILPGPVSRGMPQEILIHDEERGCRVTYAPGFLATSEANALFGFFLADAPFVAEKPVVFGKVHKVTRATCAFGDAGVRYRYAGVTREAAPRLYQHQVPKRARCRAPRVNLTFRAMHAQG